MKPFIDLTGQMFGVWHVIRRGRNQGHALAWLCRCACGTERDVLSQSLRTARSTNCGCARSAMVTQANWKHGAAAGKETGAYESWKHMRQRCQNPRNKDFPQYGGRGISVTARWLEFGNFLSDMGERPAGQTLDRIDPNGNYEPDNCRWATRAQQTANRRPIARHGMDQVTQIGRAA